MAGQFAARLGAALAGSSALAYSLSHGRSGKEAKPKAPHHASAETQEKSSSEDQLRLVQVVFRCVPVSASQALSVVDRCT